MSPNVIHIIQTNYQSKMLAIIISVYCFIISANTFLKESLVCKYFIESFFLMGRTDATGSSPVVHTCLSHLSIRLFDLM
jgi:hypothetical protein